MPLYEYRAAKQNGTTVKGKMQAQDFPSLHRALKEQGLFLTSHKEAADKKMGKRLKAKQLAEFCREIGMMLGSGVPLIRAVSIMAQRDISPKLKAVYTGVYGDLQKGVMFSEALENQQVFPELLVNMFRASEMTGGMDITARKMANHYDKTHKLNSKAKSALIYPILLAVVTVIVLFVIFLAVLPKFFDLFTDLGAELPAITSFMLNLSVSMRDSWYIILIAVLVAVLIIRTILKEPKVKKKTDQLKLRLPVVGKLLKIIYTARFARTLSSSYSSGISMINALQNTRDTIGNIYIADQFSELIQNVRSGWQLSAAIGKLDGLDSKLAASVLVGEETGRLDSMLESMADNFDYDAEIALQRLTALMEPLLIIIMAIVIGSVMISVMLPLPTLYNSIGAGQV